MPPPGESGDAAEGQQQDPAVHDRFGAAVEVGGAAQTQGVTDLGLASLLLLLILLALPYVALALLGIKWNPERSHLGEYDC